MRHPAKRGLNEYTEATLHQFDFSFLARLAAVRCQAHRCFVIHEDSSIYPQRVVVAACIRYFSTSSH